MTTIINKLFGKSKKKGVLARCPITKEQIDKGFGYLLTTAEVVSSRKYWDMVMTEPETLSYTISHFKNEENGTRMRSLIFEKYSSVEKPWMISDTCINLFESVDKEKARAEAKLWWENEGQYAPDNSGSAQQSLDPDSYRTWKDYAVLEAGRARISA
jgi:hypothetical protein